MGGQPEAGYSFQQDCLEVPCVQEVLVGQEGVGWVGGQPEAGYSFQQDCLGGSMCPRSASHKPRQAWRA